MLWGQTGETILGLGGSGFIFTDWFGLMASEFQEVGAIWWAFLLVLVNIMFTFPEKVFIYIKSCLALLNTHL